MVPPGQITFVGEIPGKKDAARISGKRTVQPNAAMQIHAAEERNNLIYHGQTPLRDNEKENHTLRQKSNQKSAKKSRKP